MTTENNINVSMIEVNPNRLMHLLKLYRMSPEELVERLNRDRKVHVVSDEIFADQIKLSHLRRIDDLFCKGIAYYADPKDLANSPGESIFFRKDHFNAELSFGAKQIVNRFEEEKLELSVLAKLADFKFERILPRAKVEENPLEVAKHVRDIFGELRATSNRDFLKLVIERFGDFNVLVFEFVETHNKKEKANIDGFFLDPNVIVLKRNQRALKREIFTLFHELAHYLLNDEEIDNVGTENVEWDQLHTTEHWCSTFAFRYLLAEYGRLYDSLPLATRENNYNERWVREIAQGSYLSSLAIYTRLRIDRKLHTADYQRIRQEILDSIARREDALKDEAQLKRKQAKEQGLEVRGSTPKPIISPLYFRTLTTALYSGLINEVSFCQKLRIKPERLAEVLS